ncbi:MAG: P-loop NTPase [Clostridia bacterium]|nr:hypothetical protein [Bacillota bacterium]MBO2521167.1 hypothetical protein [Bacillota bacterium]
MERSFEEILSILEPGQEVTLETGSVIFKGPYHSRILEVLATGLRIAAPMDNGKLVLLPVGTQVTVTVDASGERLSFETQIVDRTGGRNRSLLLCPPPPPEEEKPARNVPVVAVSSGKGGVGKTMLVVNLGIALCRLGMRVCVIDGDLGTANIDVLINVSSRYNLAHVARGERHMLEVVVEGPEGLIVLPGGSGLQELTTLDEQRFAAMLAQFRELEEYADIILIDTGSGLSPSVTNFLMAATESVLITTPEPHAITDCYALIKVLATKDHSGLLRLVVNRVGGEAEARDISRKMTFASRRFLHKELDVLGHIDEDPAVARSIRQQEPLMVYAPRSRAALQIASLAEKLAGRVEEPVRESGTQGFFRRLRRLIPGLESRA